MKRKIKIAIILLSLISLPLFAFDWPQSETASDSFFSYFGQKRGNTISTSLIFHDNAEIKTTDVGQVAVILTDHSDDFGWFDSTLGNAVIVAHDDSISTVYGNLDAASFPEEIFTSTKMPAGTSLGTSGNSGWQEGQSCLEFQVIDTKNKTAINPRILMPRMGRELPLVPGDLTLRDKKGIEHKLAWERYLPAGQYTLYRERQSVAVPFKTLVAINGATVESIPYDTLAEKQGRLCAIGNANYPVELLYPDEKWQLLANIQLSHGRNTLSVTVVDILGSAKTITYNLDIN